MIEIFRKRNILEIQIMGKYPISNWKFTFTWDAESEIYAILLVQNLQSALSDKIKKIREQEYNRGWKDAKNKNKKETYFSGMF